MDLQRDIDADDQNQAEDLSEQTQALGDNPSVVLRLQYQCEATPCVRVAYEASALRLDLRPRPPGVAPNSYHDNTCDHGCGSDEQTALSQQHVYPLNAQTHLEAQNR